MLFYSPTRGLPWVTVQAVALCSLAGRCHEIHISSTAAKVSDKGVTNILFVGIWIFVKQLPKREEMTWQAKPALECIVLPERRL
jgi:hypothetical protein